MMGSLEAMGVIPLTLEDLALLMAEDDESECKISMSYIEIYNEKILDLLRPDAQQSLEVREPTLDSVHSSRPLAATVAIHSFRHLLSSTTYVNVRPLQPDHFPD